MHTGKMHDCLVANMEFNNNGTLSVSVITNLKIAFEEYPEMITGKAVMPAADYFLTVCDKKETRLLEEERALAFHHTVVQLLLVSTRTRQDIQIVESAEKAKVLSFRLDKRLFFCCGA
jgi:hypothetical protein